MERETAGSGEKNKRGREREKGTYLVLLASMRDSPPGACTRTSACAAAKARWNVQHSDGVREPPPRTTTTTTAAAQLSSSPRPPRWAALEEGGSGTPRAEPRPVPGAGMRRRRWRRGRSATAGAAAVVWAALPRRLLGWGCTRSRPRRRRRSPRPGPLWRAAARPEPTRGRGRW